MFPGITHIFVQNYTEQCLINILEMQELTDKIICVLLMHMRNNSQIMFMMVAAVVLIHFPQIRQQKH